MILLTKLNGTPFVLNDDLVETVEETPDTTIHMTNGHVLMVREPVAEVVDRVVAFRRRILSGLSVQGAGGEGQG